MKRNPFHLNSWLAIRSAGVASLFIGCFFVLFSYIFFPITFSTALIYSLCIFAGSFLIIYAVIYRMQFSRMQKLNRLISNIAKKKFKNDRDLGSHGNDELDYLIKQAIRASNTIEREIQRLNRIEDYRKEFIGDISHELKTPIFAVQGFIETLLDGALDDQEVNRKFLKKAMRNVDRLTYLTEDLMEISKLETGELKSKVRNITLHKIITEVVENLKYKAEKEGVAIVSDEFDKNLIVKADPNQIKRALINLAENAIKYNKIGGMVTVGTKPYPQDEQRVLVYVKDTGIGMKQKYIDRVTERFFRIDKSRSREKGGTGLGLAIVKHIVEAHEEEFFIESTPNVGSTFSFTVSKV